MKPCHVCDLEPAGFHCVWGCRALLCAACADDHNGGCDLRQGVAAPAVARIASAAAPENEDGIHQDAVL